VAGAVTLLEPAPHVRAALDGGRAVVALETSMLTHGLPPPHNGRAASAMARAVRSAGAEPAWVWTEDGAVRLGTTPEELDRLMQGDAAKVARRDLPVALARGRLGGTTVSATLWAARRAGIEVSATGGIGGVHPGTGDVSADLAELARTPVTLVCSGPKSILDPAATLERLEELGVTVLGYGTDRLPFFVVRHADLPLDHNVDTPEEVTEAISARRALRLEGALLVCNPCPEEAALPAREVADAVERCTDRHRGTTGKALTPALLACLADETGGRSIEANLALLEANAALAGRIAALC
jgi:pseudouridine-5'-phosphate glycosidase